MADEPESRPASPEDREERPMPIHVDLQWTGTVLRTADGGFIGRVGNPMCACCGKRLPSDELMYRVGPGAYAFLCQECAQGDDWKYLRLPAGIGGDSEQDRPADDQDELSQF